MRGVRRAAAVRWGVVAMVVGALCAAPAVVAAWPAGDPTVPAARLLEQVRGSDRVAWSGYAEAVGRLALPEIDELGSVTRLLRGTTRLRVWWRCAQDWRVDDLQVGDEDDTYALRGIGDNATLTWHSGDRRAVVLVGDPVVRLPRGLDLVPAALARRLLSDLAPQDAVVRATPKWVAGIHAAGLAVVPGGTASTVGRLEVWADPATGLPLEVDVTARGEDRPLLTSRVLELSYGAVDAAVTTFRPGPDTVSEQLDTADIAAAVDRYAPYRLPDALAGLPRRGRGAPGGSPPDAPWGGPAVRGFGGAGGLGTYGRGLTLMAVLPLPEPQAEAVLRRIGGTGATQVALREGRGALLGTPLVSALVVRADAADRSYLLAGAVRPEILRTAAQTLLDSPPPFRRDWG